MNDSFRSAVPDVLEYLFALQQEQVRPREARARLQPLRGRHSDFRIDLLVEEVAFEQSVHYDALLCREGEGTVSLSYCPERAVPWPLRGVHRWSEGDLVRVNANVLPVHTAMACLDFIWDEAPIIERLINLCLIQEELEREPIELSDAELQEEMNKFRAAKKLFKAEDTRLWLERHGMSHESLERYVSENAMVPKLRDRVAADRVDEYFRQHSKDFDTAWVTRLVVADESEARELANQIRAGELEFVAAAERCFVDAAEHGKSFLTAPFAVIERRESATAFREQLFAATQDQLIGPVPIEKGHVLLKVLKIVPSRLDDRTRATIKMIVFDNWLAERRQAATIEWCWGNASKTD
ncbi:MAG TPA: TIGR04500 family putative peptide maturation system protein [Lacipirellulaceae bacterium]|jgi:putative peptide maturation system protein|nr:TIGR04500 family putative peptide maturation system protein [Lacipirellulaceae bacterium]